MIHSGLKEPAMPDRDLADVRLVGTLALILGVVLMLLTFTTAFFLILASTTSHGDQITQALLSLMLAIIMSVTLIGCGGSMRQVRANYSSDLENLRLVWTAL